MNSWICCQIGAREHYAIARALHQSNELLFLITDAWVATNSPLKIVIPKALRERFHLELDREQVHAFNISLIAFETIQKLQKRSGWQQIIARNQWFQHQAIQKLTDLVPKFINPPIIFSYSYAALDLFRFAKKQGWQTVLGQIDPGILEETIVIKEHKKYPQYASNWQPAPSLYWKNWQEECQLADAIVVNSNWSRQLLEEAGIEPDRIKIVPLVYTPPERAKKFIRSYPKSFSQERPLRVLFLGQVILRKGIVHFLEAIKSLEEYPMEFSIVGSKQIEIPPYFQNHPQICWSGQVNRSETAKYYQLADVFMFPTLSDGFGLTQLEAQAWQLPIIASRNCGTVIVDGVNGWVLSEVTSKTISQSLILCLERIDYLIKFAQQANTTNFFDLSCLNEKLQSIFIN